MTKTKTEVETLELYDSLLFNSQNIHQNICTWHTWLYAQKPYSKFTAMRKWDVIYIRVVLMA
jgi:hypothetical protein